MVTFINYQYFQLNFRHFITKLLSNYHPNIIMNFIYFIMQLGFIIQFIMVIIQQFIINVEHIFP